MTLIHETDEAPLLVQQDMAMEHVAESYELSPLQHGMLFHGIGHRGSGVDIEQIACQLDEQLDVEAFIQAWRRIVAQHPILRTSFHWEGLPAPRQQVHHRVELPVEQWDWRSLATEEQAQRWTTLLADDRHRGFDFTHAPLMRLTIIACGSAQYRVLWTFHHILLDGRSFPVVLREVFAVYHALRDGKNIHLPVRHPYRDYIAWLRTQDFTRAETYWRQRLHGFRAPTSFLPEKRGPEELSPKERWGACEGALSVETTTTLATFAQAHQLTLNTLLQGAWALLLHYYSGEEDIVFGATRACRPSTLTEADAMVGLFINTLPLRITIDMEASLVPWLQEIRAQHLALRPYEHTPLVKIQHWSEVPRGLPLFDSILVFENYLLDSALRAQGGEWLQRHFYYTGQTNYPLTGIAYADSELLLRLEYDRQRFADHTVKCMLGHLQTLLVGMCTAPEQPLRRIPLLTHVEERQFLERQSQTTSSSSATECLHHWFEFQVTQSPDAIALTYEGHSLTYRELNRRANQLAQRLRALGVRPDVLVGLCVERSLDLVVSILAILKAGGAYLPVDLSYPPERIAFMLEDAAAPVLVTQRQLASRLPIHQAHVVYLDDLSQDNRHYEFSAEGNFESQVTPDNLAYVIYTSGSTGKPKGVQVTHANVTRLFRMTETWFSFNAQDVWTLFHSSAFDFSVWEIWGALLYGGRLVVVPYWISRSPEAFCQLLQQEQVTVLNQTPSAFRQLLPVCIAAIPPDALSLRYVIFGGEALELQSLRPWMERYGDQTPQLVNMYGITETTVHVTYRPLTLADVRSGAGSVIGRPIPDLQVHVLTPHRTLCPIGIPGEMYVGGAGVARGYLRRPELTTERFIADPFRTGTNATLYKTGDLARWLDNGELEYLGRIDHQVKIRGFRIELGEIEAALNQQPHIQEAIVLAREDTPGDKRLVAYVVTTDGTELEDVRPFLRNQLPEYMLPSAFVRLPALPLTTNGKVDRRALPPPDQERPVLQQRYVAPRTPLEHRLCQLWSAVLGVREVGVHDNFFELGGDSILSIQVIAKARQAGIQLTPKDLFQYPTIAEIATHCSPSTPTPLDQGPATGAVALTPIQQWFFEHDLSQRQYWNQAFLCEVPADLDSPLLEEAFRAVVEHHDALRLRFTPNASGWSQSYAVNTNLFSCTRMDLSALPQTMQESVLTSTATELQATLNLTEGPLLRAIHFWRGPHQSGRLVIVAHHLVIDGVSWRLLLEDLESAYLALQERKPVQLPPKTASFQTWAAHLRAYARHPELQAEYTYWRHLVETQGASLPVDNPAHEHNWEADAEALTVRLSRAETDALLHHTPTRHRAHINELLLTALRWCFDPWIGTQPLLIDLEGHGREDIGQPIDVSRTIGWFTTIFPVRLDAAPTQDLAQTLHTIKTRLRQLPHHGLGYGLLRYLGNDSTLTAMLRAAPQAQVSFNYLGQFDAVVSGSSLFRFAKESCGPWHSPHGQRTHLLEVLALVVDGQLEVRWIYNRQIHEQKTITRLAERYLSALQEFITVDETSKTHRQTPEDFPLAQLDQSTLDRVLQRYQAIEDVYPLSPMQRLFYSMETNHAGLGFEQWRFTLHGPLQVDALQRAWRQVVHRHPILRTAFFSEDVSEPLQIVLPHVSVSWTEEDWRTLSPAQYEERLRDLLQHDRERGFTLTQPGLTRFTVIRSSDETYQLIWSTHHLLIDGWSWPVIFQELSQWYDAQCRGQELKLDAPCAYRDYVSWLQRQQDDEARVFWQQRLAGITTPTTLPLNRRQQAPAHQAAIFAEARGCLSTHTTAALQTLARTQRCTLNTIIQGSWALILSHYSGAIDVLFGAAFSGRPPEVPGIEGMVGPCVNNLPMRIHVAADTPCTTWLNHIQERQFAVSQYQYSSLLQIQEWSSIPWRFRMFESLLVFQNYVVGEATRRLGSAVEIRTLSTPETTNYPLTLIAVPGPELQLKILYRPDQFEREDIRRLVDDWRTILETMAASPTALLSDLVARLPDHAPPSLSPSASLTTTATPQVNNTSLLPHTDMERRIAAIWQELFQLETISLDDNFFDLGGHSLLLVQAHRKLQTALKTTLPILSLLQYPTIRSLARHFAQEAPEPSTAQATQERARRQHAALAQRKLVTRRA